MMKCMSTDAEFHIIKIDGCAGTNESIEIISQGNGEKWVTAPETLRRKIDVMTLRKLHEDQQAKAIPITDFIRQMRDSDRY